MKVCSMHKSKIKKIFHSSVLLLCLSLFPNFAAAGINKNYCVYGETGINFDIKLEWYDAKGTPVASVYSGEFDTVPVWQWACAPTGATSVKFSVLGANIGNHAIKATLQGDTELGGVVTCVGSLGAGCPAAPGASTAASQMISNIPDSEGQFLKMMIPREAYIRVWGSLWDPVIDIGAHACNGC